MRGGPEARDDVGLGDRWLVLGVMTFVAAFSVKQGRPWRIFMGLLGILAGIIILTYPISSALTLAFIGASGWWSSGSSRSSPGSSCGTLVSRPDVARLRAILSRGASPAPVTLAASAFARDPAFLAPA